MDAVEQLYGLVSAAPHDANRVWLSLDDARAILAHIAALEKRAADAEAERDAARQRGDVWVEACQSLQRDNAQLVQNWRALKAERDAAKAEIAQVVAYLRQEAQEWASARCYGSEQTLIDTADAIEAGEHRKDAP